DDRQRTLASLDAQLYPDHELFDGSRPADLLESSEAGTPRFLIRIEPGDALDQRALYELARAINADPSLDLIYADDDEIAGGIRSRPSFRPDWSPGAPAGFDMGPAACVRGALAAALWPNMQGQRDLIVRATERTSRVHHVRQVLCHRSRPAPPGGPEAKPTNGVARRKHQAGVAVVYLARGADAEPLARFRTFAESYARFRAGTAHELFIIFKGFRGAEDLS